MLGLAVVRCRPSRASLGLAVVPSLLLGTLACGARGEPTPAPVTVRVPRATSRPSEARPPLPACPEACRGGITDALEEGITERVKETHRCYDRALAREPTLKGKMMIRMTVEEDGNACGARVLSDEIGDPELTRCLLEGFSGVGLPPPAGGCLHVNIPLTFLRAWADAGVDGG